MAAVPPPALVCVVTIGALAAVLGAPLALALRDATQRPFATLFDATLFGLAAGGVLLTALGIVGPALALPGLVVWIALTVWLAVRRGLPHFRWLRPRRPDGWTIALGVTLTAGSVARLRSTNELAWIGDMGAYVNWANEFARTGGFHARWPPLFPALMAAPADLFGYRFTTSVVPLFGILVLAGLLRVTSLLRVARPVQLGVLVVAAASPHLLWFSTFPASEMLQAALLLGLVAVTTLALRPEAQERRLSRHLTIGLATALLAAALILNRGQALGLVAPVLLLAGVLVGVPRAVSPPALRWWTAAALLGLGAGHVYGVVVIPQYWIQMQLQSMVPARVLALARDVGLLRGLTATVIIIGLTGAVTLVLWLVDRAVARYARPGTASSGEPARAPRRLASASVMMAIAGVVLIAHSGSGEVDAALSRMGWLIAVLAIPALLLPAARARGRGPAVLLLGTVAVVFLTIEVLRFGPPELHTVYLYWDRYLTSEYLPAVLCLGAVSVAAVVETLGERKLLRRAGLALAGAGAVALVVSWLPRLELQTSHRAYSGMYEFVAGLAARTDPDLPVVWTADAPGNVPRIFPNSVWAFGAALRWTWGRDVVDLPIKGSPFIPDPVATRAEVETTAACATTRTASVVEWIRDPNRPGIATRLAGGGLTWTDRGRVEYTTWVLGQGPREVFQPVQLVAEVYEVTAAPDVFCRNSR
jgi:hypothetical protein